MDGFNCMKCGYWPCDLEPGQCPIKPAAWYCGCGDDEETEIWNDAFKKNTVAMLSSYYEGDIIYDNNHSCSAVATLPNGKIVMALPHNSQIGGKLLLVNPTNNHYTWYDANIGHANSMTWDNKNKKLIINPMYKTGTSTEWKEIIEITFSDIDATDPTIAVETYKTGMNWLFMGVAYSYSDNKVYLMRWGGREVYTWENHTPVYFCNLLGDWVSDHTDVAYNQGFAVHEDCFYISHAKGYIGVYSRLTGEHIREWLISKEDFNGFYFFGELEDFDFDKNGNLFAARYVVLPGSKIDAFYTYIPTNKVLVAHPQGANSAANWTFYLDNEKHDTFKNNWTHIKDPNQLDIIGSKYNQVNKLSINCTYDLGIVSLNLPILLNITKMVCKQLEISADVSLYSAVSGANIEFTHPSTQTWSIFLSRIAFLRLINHEGNNLTFTTPNGILGVRIDDYLPMLANRANLIINGSSTYGNPTLFEIGGNTYAEVRGFYVGMNQVDVWNG